MRKVLKERKFKAGYIVRTELLSGVDAYGAEPFEMKVAYTPGGDYIGDTKWAYRLCKTLGIKPEKSKPGHNVCSIGFCDDDQKWYGWSHRAICGFGIGDRCKRGDCAYVPTDKEDARADAVTFWQDDFHYDVVAEDDHDKDGRFTFNVSWKYTEGVPNTKLRGRTGGVVHYPPEIYGRGEWEAKTLEEAKQMAIDFAEGVS